LTDLLYHQLSYINNSHTMNSSTKRKPYFNETWQFSLFQHFLPSSKSFLLVIYRVKKKITSLFSPNPRIGVGFCREKNLTSCFYCYFYFTWFSQYSCLKVKISWLLVNFHMLYFLISKCNRHGSYTVL
jgi:hypothetical protein